MGFKNWRRRIARACAGILGRGLAASSSTLVGEREYDAWSNAVAELGESENR